MDSQLFWKYEMLHNLPNHVSENGPIFSLEYWIALYKLRMKQDPKQNNDPSLVLRSEYGQMQKCMDSIVHYIGSNQHRIFSPNGYNLDPNVHFSHDNMLGLHGLGILNCEDNAVRDLPHIIYNGNFQGHLTETPFLFLLKLKVIDTPTILDVLGYMFTIKSWFRELYIMWCLAYLFVSSIFSCLRSREITSGKRLWWTRIGLLEIKYRNDERILFICKYWMKFLELLLKCKGHGEHPFVDVHNVYYPNIYQPTRNIIHEFFKGEEDAKVEGNDERTTREDYH